MEFMRKQKAIKEGIPSCSINMYLINKKNFHQEFNRYIVVDITKLKSDFIYNFVISATRQTVIESFISIIPRKCPQQ